MFDKPQFFNPKDQEAIQNISQLIIQLEEKKREWKSLKPKYLNYNRRTVFIAESILLEDDVFLRNFGRIMKHLKKINIKICSDYIFLLEKSIMYIRKQHVKRDAQLRIILQTLNGLYQKATKSEIVSDLKKIHKIEFEDALRVKKHHKEFYQKIQAWDVDWMEEHGLDVPHFKHPESLEKFQRAFARHGNWKNWRNDTLVKNELQRVFQFKTFLKIIIEKYGQIINTVENYF